MIVPTPIIAPNTGAHSQPVAISARTISSPSITISTGGSTSPTESCKAMKPTKLAVTAASVALPSTFKDWRVPMLVATSVSFLLGGRGRVRLPHLLLLAQPTHPHYLSLPLLLDVAHHREHVGAHRVVLGDLVAKISHLVLAVQ